MRMFNIPNLFTAANLMCGVLSIILTFAGRIDLAPFAIFLGGIFDFFDGFLARKLKLSGEMGKQLDSLADMVTFGLAPGFLMMVVIIVSIYIDVPYEATNFASHVHFELQNWINAIFYNVPNQMDAPIKWLPLFALVIPFFSMFRLAKFNIDTRQSDSFIGVPTPLNTIFFTFFPLIMWIEFDTWRYDEGIFAYLFNSYFLVGLCVFMSLLLVSELKLFSLKFKHFKWKGNEIRFSFLLISMILIPTLLVWSIPLIVFLQLILSLVDNLLFKNKQHEIQS
ncbi:MAG: CDP-diacylglycerol--serine O-phosphatidyltransferase [Crocinitomicaceae bacterium]|nr:MAG: CDP-diacylglycerol--serine O-phosphatidyltransferase [Crocinitomicaceae bacterium]